MEEARDDGEDTSEDTPTAGVREYIVWRTWDEALDWFRLGDDGYERVEPEDGLIESRLFPGLVLDVDALLRGDYAAVLQRVLASTPGDKSSAS